MDCRHGPAKRRLYVGMANLSPKRVLPGQKLRRLGLLLDKRLCGGGTRPERKTEIMLGNSHGLKVWTPKREYGALS